MTLDKCQCNNSYKIASISIKNELTKERFASLGIASGALLTLLHISPKKATLSIQVDKTLIALRSEEAKYIHVEML